MTQTRELSPLVLPYDLDSDFKLGTDHIYTVTLSVNFGFMAGFADSSLGRTILRIVSAVVAVGGIVVSLAVIVLAPLFPSLVSTVPPQVSYPPIATSSPPRRRRTYGAPASITVSVRRDPNIIPIIERSERDSTSPSPAPPPRRVSFSPQSSSTSVPTLSNGFVDPPSYLGSSNGHPTPAMRRVLGQGIESGAYILPTPPASIASISSEGDEAVMEEFGMVSPGVGKRGRRSFLFAPKRGGSVKGKDKQAVEDGEQISARRRAHSIALSALEGASKRSSWLSHSSRESSAFDETVRESESETDRGDRTSTTEKENKKRSGLSFQDFKAAFVKRERRASVLISTSGSYALSPSEVNSTPRSLGLGRPSSVSSQTSPRSASDELSRKKRANSPPLRLDTLNSSLETERREVQSPVDANTRPLISGEVVIRNESGRRRTRTTAIPGLYTDAEVVRRW